MNRSLEALAIFAICLGGMLAVVRYSAQDRTADRRVEEAAAPAVPAKSSGTAAEPQTPADLVLSENQLTYDAGCGLDRDLNQHYTPNRPLLSPREVALRAILSPPIPLMILPVESEVATGYDAAYDAAMCPTEVSELDLSRAEIEREYAAAELAAANPIPENSELIADSPICKLLSGTVQQIWAGVSAETAHLRRSYVDPASRAIENRWSSEFQRLLRYPRAKAEAREHLLLRQRVEAKANGPVSWDDYLGFTERKLPVRATERAEPRVAEQKRPRNVLWPR
jgi:hypothetical protein